MLIRFFTSPYLMFFLLFALGLSAGVATFVENDFGTLTARSFFYESWWFGLLLIFVAVNILAVIYTRKMWIKPWRFILHLSFLFILCGALITHFFAIEGSVKLAPNEAKDSFLGTAFHLHVKVQKENKKIIKSYPLPINAWSNAFNATLKLDNKDILLKLESAKVEKLGLSTKTKVDIGVKIGDKKALFQLGENEKINKKLDGFSITLSYAPMVYRLPFEILLEKFELIYYPGGYAPATYKSRVKIKDKSYAIKMNEPLRIDGYSFYQSSYEKESSILWVSKDPGKWPTYIGYGLLFLGLILNLFDPTSRIRKLASRAKRAEMTLCLFLIFTTLPLFGGEYEQNYLNALAHDSKALSQEWGSLIVQTKSGRMMPLDTLNREIVRKLTGKKTHLGLDANQIVLGMFTHQRLWKRLALIKVDSDKLKEIIGVSKSTKLAKFEDFFTKQTYKLDFLVKKALQKPQKSRNKFEKELLKVDERLNIALMTFYGTFFKFFPNQEDPNKAWRSIDKVYKSPMNKQEEALKKAIVQFMDKTFERDFNKAIEPIKLIKAYANSSKIHIPKPLHVKLEIMLNKLDIFSRLIGFYLILGLLALCFGFYQAIVNKRLAPVFNKILLTFVIAGFIFHTCGILGRWIVAGFIPLSNTYESIIYIAYSSILAGLLLFKRSFFGLGGALILSGIFLFVAHLGNIDPNITPLVPVLDSFWLSLHVSIITASYGFLGVGALLGVVVLLLYACLNRFNIKNEQINYLTNINEIALLVGLTLLVIGNFLGGIWANESWGRYWGWDPKETWTFIAIITYVLITHLRFIPKLYSPLNFALGSILGYGTILMTYFGVNFYLAGLHSYAKGDPVKVPLWIYAILGLVGLIYFLAWKKYTFYKERR